MSARPEPPIAGDDTATMVGSLERQRATFAWKCAGVDADGLNTTVGASTLLDLPRPPPTTTAVPFRRAL